MVRVSTDRRLTPARVAAVVPAVLVVALAGSACSPGTRAAKPAVAPEPPQAEFVAPLAPPAPPEDPALTLIALADQHFRAGQHELDLGHVEGARVEFDRAVSVLLESPYGGRTEPRIREYFDRLIDRISAYEIKALAAGDGFTEKQSEPASIDELLAVSATFTPPEPEPALQAAVEGDPVVHDIPIPLNPRVLSFIALFQGRLHDFLAEGMQRGTKYLPMIQEVFRAEGLPLDLAYIPLIESAFKPNALSRAKAKGVWQFMSYTGRENGLRQDWYVDERSDPEKATVAAAKYLTTLAKMFDGDWHLAMASYNGGPGRVQRALKRGRVDDFWSLSAKRNLLPRETRDYVPMILAAVVIARNPAQYGFAVSPESPLEYDTVTLPRPVDLRHIAEWTDQTIDDIQALNPELRRWTTPVRDTDYELRVPEGTADLVQVRLGQDPGADLVALNYHTVKRGETLATIARKLRVNRTDLAEANYLKTSARVAVGQNLIIPQQPTVLMAARSDRAVPAVDARPLTADAVVPAVLTAETTADARPASAPDDRVKVVYRVKRGDTLASIARVFKTSVASIRTWNGISGSRINAGERLTIYTARAN
jgi:membrane-bound lytic murein transglycosylase D